MAPKKNYARDAKACIDISFCDNIRSSDDYPVAVIAGAVGYANPFQFSNTFKKYYGISPGEYRKKNSKK